MKANEATGNEVSVEPFRAENGYIKIPMGLGLGLGLNEEALLKRPYQEQPKRVPRQYHEEGP